MVFSPFVILSEVRALAKGKAKNLFESRLSGDQGIRELEDRGKNLKKKENPIGARSKLNAFDCAQIRLDRLTVRWKRIRQ